ncbi:hypothetical protein MMC14_002619 [Varicellaria rhodocarpa]|nr:hypothetical protein [Varicellaria rhodocarpa]
MTKHIRITADHSIQIEAAIAFSKELKKLDIRHAFIGGFALSIYGHNRSTQDIDILVDIPPSSVQSFLRPEVTRLNRHFNLAGLKYYYAPSLIGDLEGEQLVLANDANVIIETLPTKLLGLPSKICPIFEWTGPEETSVDSDDCKVLN